MTFYNMSIMLRKYTQRIEEGLILSVAEMGEKNRLRDSCEYSLMGGGKRIRPLLVLLIGEALEKGGDVLPSALSVEFFHTASLIADDLPCMDNDDFRRNRSSLHKEFGESVAILSSYTLIAAGYEGIYKNAVLMKKNKGLAERADAAVLFSLETAARCAGIQGATNGQFLDLFPPDQSGETIQKIIYQYSKKNMTITGMTLPVSPYELDVQSRGVSYIEKYNLLNDANYQIGTYFTTLQYIKTNNIPMPTQYVDLRVPGKAFFK